MTEQCQHAPPDDILESDQQEKVQVLNLQILKRLDLGSDTILRPSLQTACKSLFRTIFQELHGAGQVFIPSQKLLFPGMKKPNLQIDLLTFLFLSLTFLKQRLRRSLMDLGVYFVDGHVSCTNFKDVTVFQVKRVDKYFA